MLIAIGGNALIRDGQRGTIAEQFDNSRAIARQVAALVAAGWRVVVTHGNGPQVGFILLRWELATDDVTIPTLSLDMAVADSQGGLGYPPSPSAPSSPPTRPACTGRAIAG
jgi:carbamate kinase